MRLKGRFGLTGIVVVAFQNHGVVFELAFQFENGAAAADPKLMPVFGLGIVVINAGAGKAVGVLPLLENGAIFAGSADLTRADGRFTLR